MKRMILLFVVLHSHFIYAQKQNVVTDFNSLLKQVEKVQNLPDSKNRFYFQRKQNFYVEQYLCFHPKELNAFYQKSPELFKEWIHLGGATFINRTNISDQFISSQLKQKYPNDDGNFYKTPLDRKYHLLRLILSRCIGSKHTLDFLNYVEQEYPEPELKIIFKRYPEFIDIYNSYKQAMKDNVDLYEEISHLNEKDIHGWRAVTFSYAHEKYKEYYLKNERENTATEKESSESPMAVFMQDFLNTFNSEDTVKIQRQVDPENLFALFKMLNERGGQCDFRSERLIKKITFYQNYAPRMSISRHNIEITDSNCAFLGDQTLIFDSNGKFQYILSQFYGHVPMPSQELGDNDIQAYLRNWLFSFGKVVYKDGKPIDFIATQILADEDIFKQIDSAVRSDLKINLLDMVNDGKENRTIEGPVNYCFYELQKLGFTNEMRGGLSYCRFSDYFPYHPDTEGKVKVRFLKDKISD